MSEKCGNGECADRTQFIEGNSFVLEVVTQTEKINEVMVMEENDGKCKCGSSCSCVNCTCGDH